MGEEGSKAILGPDSPTTPYWTPAPTLRARAQVTEHLSTSACSMPGTTTQREGTWSQGHTQATQHRLQRRQTLSRAALQVPCLIRPQRRRPVQSVRLCSREGGRLPGDVRGAPMKSHSHLLPCPPTLLIQDLRLHMAFLLFTASHSRRWPAGQEEGEPMLLRRSPPHRGCFLRPPGGRPPLDSAQRSNAKEQAIPTNQGPAAINQMGAASHFQAILLRVDGGV